MKPRKAVGPLEGRGFTVETTDSPQDFCCVHPFLPLTQEPLLSTLTLHPTQTQHHSPAPPRAPGIPLLGFLLLGILEFGHSSSSPRPPGVQPPAPPPSDPGSRPPSLPPPPRPENQAPGPLLHTLTRTTSTSLWSCSPAVPPIPSPCLEPGSRNSWLALAGGSGSSSALLAPSLCLESGSGKYWPALVGGSGSPQALLAGMLGGTRGQLGRPGP